MVTSAWSCRKVSRAANCNLVVNNADLFPWCRQRGRIQSGRVNLRLGDSDVASVMRVPRLVAEGEVAVDIVLELHRPEVHIGLEIVSVLKPVIVAAFHRSRTVEQPGDAVVRGVVGSLAQVTEREAIWATQAECQGGSDAVAPVLGNITPGKLRIVSHHVQAESGPAAERLQRPVQIGCDPLDR